MGVTHRNDGVDWDAVGLNHEGPVLNELLANGASVVGLHRQDTGSSSEGVLVGDEGSSALCMEK